MNDNQLEVTSEESKEKVAKESEYFRSLIAGIYAIFSASAISIDLLYQNRYEEYHFENNFSKVEKLLYNENIVQHIGNLKWCLCYVSIATIGEIVLKTLSKKDELKLLQKARQLFPYYITTFIFAINLDTETFQKYSGSYGTPDLLDVPAGLFGILTGALIFELVHRSKYLNSNITNSDRDNKD